MKLTLLLPLLLASFLWLTGCAMSNDQVIRETKKCTDAGMKVEALPGIVVGIMSVSCIPKDSDRI